MTNYSNYTFSDRKTIERIITVKEWNELNPDNKISVKYGYVMPVYGGYHWKAKKQELINIYTFGPVR